MTITHDNYMIKNLQQNFYTINSLHAKTNFCMIIISTKIRYDNYILLKNIDYCRGKSSNV